MVLREGDEAARIRQQIEALKPGQRLHLNDLPSSLQCFTRGIAKGLGLWVSKAKDAAFRTPGAMSTVEVFNLGGSIESFAEGMKHTLSDLAHGEMVELPTTLSAEQRFAVKQVAKEMGYKTHMLGSGADKNLAVANLEEFQTHVKATLENLQPGESHEFELGHYKYLLQNPCDVAFEKQTVKNVVGSFCFTVRNSHRSQDGTVLTVEAHGKDHKGGDEMTESTEEQVALLFDKYANGRSGDQRFLMRKPDLTNFVEDAARANAPRAKL